MWYRDIEFICTWSLRVLWVLHYIMWKEGERGFPGKPCSLECITSDSGISNPWSLHSIEVHTPRFSCVSFSFGPLPCMPNTEPLSFALKYLEFIKTFRVYHKSFMKGDFFPMCTCCSSDFPLLRAFGPRNHNALFEFREFKQEVEVSVGNFLRSKVRIWIFLLSF